MTEKRRKSNKNEKSRNKVVFDKVLIEHLHKYDEVDDFDLAQKVRRFPERLKQFRHYMDLMAKLDPEDRETFVILYTLAFRYKNFLFNNFITKLPHLSHLGIKEYRIPKGLLQ